jgi:hypothetical protein
MKIVTLCLCLFSISAVSSTKEAAPNNNSSTGLRGSSFASQVNEASCLSLKDRNHPPIPPLDQCLLRGESCSPLLPDDCCSGTCERVTGHINIVGRCA